MISVREWLAYEAAGGWYWNLHTLGQLLPCWQAGSSDLAVCAIGWRVTEGWGYYGDLPSGYEAALARSALAAHRVKLGGWESHFERILAERRFYHEGIRSDWKTPMRRAVDAAPLPGKPGLEQTFADWLYQAKEYDSACAMLRTAIKQAATDQRFQRVLRAALAAALLAKGDLAAARAQYESLLSELRPELPRRYHVHQLSEGRGSFVYTDFWVFPIVSGYAACLQQSGLTHEADAALQQWIQAFERLLEFGVIKGAEGACRGELAGILRSYAQLKRSTGQAAESEKLLVHAITLLPTDSGLEFQFSDGRSYRAGFERDLGDTYASEEKWAEAEKMYRSALIHENAFFAVGKQAAEARDARIQDLTAKMKTIPQPNVSANRGTMSAVGAGHGAFSFATGRRYALLVATDDYKTFPHLPNPIADAGDIKVELEQTFGFETELVANPTKLDRFNAIAKLKKRDYGPADQLLVFIAGHGTFDEHLLKEGLLVCADTQKDDPTYSSYLDYSTLSKLLDNLPCRHILLMLDVCFGGTFDKRIEDEQSGTRGDDADPDVDVDTLLRRGVDWATRKVLTSGAKEPVLDGKPGQHSPFARKLLEIFRTRGLSEKVLTFEDIVAPMQRLRTKAIYGDFGHYDPGSSFYFVRKTGGS